MNQAEQYLCAGTMARHRHVEPYAAIVISGSYLETGDDGCWRLEAGDVVSHGAFSAHMDFLPAGGAVVVNVPLPSAKLFPAVFRVADPDALVRAAADPAHAAALLDPVETRGPLVRDWPDTLAVVLRHDPGIAIGIWAEHAGIAPATVSRGFAAAYGVTPARYRAEARARAAWRRIRFGKEPLADVAAAEGFADQAHMTRAIGALTGKPPAAWRRINSVQDRQRART